MTNNFAETESLVQLSRQLVDWYWRFGKSRTGKYALSTGSWLEIIYDTNLHAGRIASIPATSRRTMALWGPSQSGKSTLLSRFLDRETNGMLSALQWDVRQPVEFVGKDIHSTKINPYNLKADASGCVTRFVLTDAPEYVDCPVQLILATPDQVIESLAIGYITECDQSGEVVYWDRERISKKISSFKSSNGNISRDAYELLHQATVVVGDLILAQWARYHNLHKDWRGTRMEILSAPALVTNVENARQFVADLFWDGNTRLLEVFEQCKTELNNVRRHGNRFFADHATAARLLNISSAEETKQGVPCVCIASRGDDAILSLKVSRKNTDVLPFAKLQAIIWEIRLPINRATLTETAPEIVDVLSSVDLIDFPGVSQQGDGGTNPRLENFNEVDVFTKIFKRGKTASVVVTYSGFLAIDGFSLLVRMQSALPQPRQLIAGLTAWTGAMGLQWPPVHTPPPLNLVLTFSAKLVSDIANSLSSGRSVDSLDKVFTWFEKINSIANSNWANFWTTSYPRFADEGRLPSSLTEATISGACDAIENNPAFRDRFRHKPDIIRKMAMASRDESGDGAVTEFICSIPRSLAGSRLDEMRSNRIKEMSELLIQAIRDALPMTSEQQTRTRDFEEWKTAIIECCHTRRDHNDPVKMTCRSLSAVLSVDAMDLDPLPANASTKNIDGYINDQVRKRWYDQARSLRQHHSRCGLNDPQSASTRLSYLADAAVINGGLSQWIKSNLGELERNEDRARARAFLSVKIGDLLVFGRDGRRADHRSINSNTGQSEVNRALNQYAEQEMLSDESGDPKLSPHYAAIIEPFFKHLETVARSTGVPREPQPGDQELQNIYSNQDLRQ
jgi:hypothetical protein